MAKKSVGQKMVAFAQFYEGRIDSAFREEEPKRAVFWATMIHSLFSLAKDMSPDGQISKPLLDELIKIERRADHVLRMLGPSGYGSPGLAGVHMDPDDPVMAAYQQFRDELEMLGLV